MINNRSLLIVGGLAAAAWLAPRVSDNTSPGYEPHFYTLRISVGGPPPEPSSGGDHTVP